MNEEQKLPPYQRLKTILTEGDSQLTEKAAKNLDEILGIKPKEPTFWDKVKDFFLKVDQKIFSKPYRKWNTYYHKRK
jgi:hypothetical protein